MEMEVATDMLLGCKETNGQTASKTTFQHYMQGDKNKMDQVTAGPATNNEEGPQEPTDISTCI